jgi:hypothetical protein
VSNRDIVKINSFFIKPEEEKSKNMYNDEELKLMISDLFDNTTKYDHYQNDEGKFIKSFKVDSILTLFSIHITKMSNFNG